MKVISLLHKIKPKISNLELRELCRDGKVEFIDSPSYRFLVRNPDMHLWEVYGNYPGKDEYPSFVQFNKHETYELTPGYEMRRLGEEEIVYKRV